MSKPTGKLKFAYETIMNMESKINELKAKIKKLEQPDIFWLKDDSENRSDNPYELISEFVDKESISSIVELEVASRLPNMKVKILPCNDNDNDNGVVELVEYDSYKTQRCIDCGYEPEPQEEIKRQYLAGCNG